MRGLCDPAYGSVVSILPKKADSEKQTLLESTGGESGLGENSHNFLHSLGRGRPLPPKTQRERRFVQLDTHKHLTFRLFSSLHFGGVPVGVCLYCKLNNKKTQNWEVCGLPNSTSNTEFLASLACIFAIAEVRTVSKKKPLGSFHWKHRTVERSAPGYQSELKDAVSGFGLHPDCFHYIPKLKGGCAKDASDGRMLAGRHSSVVPSLCPPDICHIWES